MLIELKQTLHISITYRNQIHTDLVEKITEIPNIYEKHPNFKGKPSFKKWCNYWWPLKRPVWCCS